MPITDLLKRIDNAFAQSNASFPQLPGILVQCGAVNRSGLSAIRELQESVKKMQALGIPITMNVDGSPNDSINYAWSILSSIHTDIEKNGRTLTTITTPWGTIDLHGIFY